MHNVEKSAFRKGEYIGYGGGDVWRIVKNGNTWRATPRKDINLREFSASTLKEISAGLESLTAPERKTNPAPRKRAIYRPSQVTKKAPSKRLVARRKVAAKKPVKGYFPNPATGKQHGYFVDIKREKSAKWVNVSIFKIKNDALTFAQDLAKRETGKFHQIRVMAEFDKGR